MAGQTSSTSPPAARCVSGHRFLCICPSTQRAGELGEKRTQSGLAAISVCWLRELISLSPRHDGRSMRHRQYRNEYLSRQL